MKRKEKVIQKIGVAIFLSAASTMMLAACGEDSQGKKASSILPDGVEKKVTPVSIGEFKMNAAPTTSIFN